jgi:cytochrome c oxidase assembly factor CtaG
VAGLALQLLPAVAFAVLYALRTRTLQAHGHPVPGWRRACWFSGLAVIVAALGSPLGTSLSDHSFAAHMAEHLLIADIAALLLVLGLTGPLLAPLLRNPLLAPLRHLTHPAPALALWALDLLVWHVPGPHQAAVRHDGVHALEHLMFVGFGMGMWMALRGPLPKPTWFGNLARLGYVVVVRLFETALANVFVWTDHPLYPVYGKGVTDQIIAGSVMMVEGSVLTLCLGCWLFLRAAREGEERQELLELAAARGLELTERRAARAVAAGRGAELRARLEAGGEAPSGAV